MITKIKKICLYAHYDEDNIFSDDDIKTLNLLSNEFDKIIIISSNTNFDINIKNCEFFYCKNKGFDFGKHEFFLKKRLKSILKYDYICLTNNSYIGCRNFKNSIEKMINKKYDWWGYTSSSEQKLHIQSYFLFFNNQSFKYFYNFLSDVSPYYKNLSHYDIIQRIELQLLNFMNRQNFKHGTFVDAHLLHPEINSTIKYAAEIIFLEKDFPLFKKKAIQKKLYTKEFFTNLASNHG